MVIIVKCYRGALLVLRFRSSEGVDDRSGVHEDEAAGLVGEGLGREGCRGFPLVLFKLTTKALFLIVTQVIESIHDVHIF